MTTTIAPPIAATRGQRLVAAAVHAYTATGVVLALLMVHFAYEGQTRTVLWLFGAAMIIDGTDGFMARRLRVKKVLPGFDGALLDNIVDYITYVFAPMALLWSTGHLPSGAWGAAVAAVPLLASCVQFCRTAAKGGDDASTGTRDHHFLGFPSYWNIVAFYLVVFQAGAVASTVVLMVCTVLVFVPITYIYPSRTRLLRRTTLTLTAAWLVLYAVIVAQLPAPHPIWLALSLGYIAYYLAASLRLTFAAPRPQRRPTS